MVTLIKKTLATRVDKESIIKDTEGRILIIPIRTLLEDKRIWIQNVYGPASQREESTKLAESVTQSQQTDKEPLSQGEESDQLTKEKEKFYRSTLRKTQTHLENS